MIVERRAHLGRLLPPNAHVVEIGVAEGRFSLEILRWGVARLYLVDTWAPIPDNRGTGGWPQEWHEKNWARMNENVAPFIDRVTILRGLSHDMAFKVPDESLDMVYLDGDHSYKGVFVDLHCWFPKLKQGGIMAGHDYLNSAYGVRDAVETFVGSAYPIHIIPEAHAPEGAGFWFRNE